MVRSRLHPVSDMVPDRDYDMSSTIDVQLWSLLARRCLHTIELTLKLAKRILFVNWFRKVRSPKLVTISRPSRYENSPHISISPSLPVEFRTLLQAHCSSIPTRPCRILSLLVLSVLPALGSSSKPRSSRSTTSNFKAESKATLEK